MGKGNKGFGGLPSKDMLERLAEQNEFRKLVVTAYLNGLAKLVGAGRFLAFSEITDEQAEEFDSLPIEYVLYDDREENCIVSEDGTKFCPIITELLSDEEHGMNATECADTKYGGKMTTFRVVIPAPTEEDEAPEKYIVCECAGVDICIVVDSVDGGRWYAQ